MVKLSSSVGWSVASSGNKLPIEGLRLLDAYI